MENKKLKIVMLCGNVQSSKFMYNSLADLVNIVCVVLENKPPASHIIRIRLKRLGFFRVSGQLLFIMFNKIYQKTSNNRISHLISDYKLNGSDFPEKLVRKVDSINDEKTIKLLKSLKPDAVVVNGTRIISKNILSSTDVPFINAHMGITPRYRGVHGGYWALANNDVENCGVTIHLVDEGVDTGTVLYQDTIYPGHNDNFNTYPLHQIAKAIPLMKQALNNVYNKVLSSNNGVQPSKQWYHPTLLEYIKYYLRSGVK